MEGILPTSTELIEHYHRTHDKDALLDSFAEYETHLSFLQSYLDSQPDGTLSQQRDLLLAQFTILEDFVNSEIFQHSKFSSPFELEEDSEEDYEKSSGISGGFPEGYGNKVAKKGQGKEEESPFGWKDFKPKFMSSLMLEEESPLEMSSNTPTMDVKMKGIKLDFLMDSPEGNEKSEGREVSEAEFVDLFPGLGDDESLISLGSCRMSLDSCFTYLNRNRVLLDIVDDHWIADKLPDDDIVLNLEHSFLNQTSLEEDDEDKVLQPEENWADLGLDYFKFNFK